MAIVKVPTNSEIRNRIPRPILNHIFFGKTTQFYFPVSPREISFSNLSAKFEEIPRPSKYPLIVFDELNLTQVSLSFRLFDKKSAGAKSVESQVDLLRRIATAPGIVWFQGIDKLLQVPLQPISIAGNKTRNVAYWRITDLSMDVVYRDRMNKPTQVDCEIQLTEERNPLIPTITLPKISYVDAPPRVAAARPRRRRRTPARPARTRRPATNTTRPDPPSRATTVTETAQNSGQNAFGKP